MKQAKIYAVIGIAILGFCISTNAIASDKEDKAITAAQAWLALIDEGNYGKLGNSRGVLQTGNNKRQMGAGFNRGQKTIGHAASQEITIKNIHAIPTRCSGWRVCSDPV